MVATLEQMSDANIPSSARKCLEEIEPSMSACSKICDEFTAKLIKIASHSDANHKSFRDAIKLQFQDKDILSFKYRLGSYKATLNIALAMVSLYEFSLYFVNCLKAFLKLTKFQAVYERTSRRSN